MHRTLFPIAGLLVVTLLAATPAAAAEVAEQNLEHEERIAEGGSLRVENLLGSITILSDAEPGQVRVRARVVAEADDFAEARELAESVRIESTPGDNGLEIRIVFPVDDHTAFRMPKSEVDGIFSKWVTPLIKKSTVSTEYGGRLVEVGQSRKGTPLTVHVRVSIPLEISASFKQTVGSIRCAGLRGDVGLEIVEGVAVAEQIYGSLNARTGGGELTVLKFHGERFDVHTATGRIELVDIDAEQASLRTGAGEIEGRQIVATHLLIQTDSGNVTLDDIDTGSLQVESDSGKVDLSTELTRTRQATIDSGSGDIVLRLGRLAPFLLDARSEKGEIKLKGMTADVLDQGDHMTKLQRRTGGAELIVTTETGDLTLKPL